MKRRWLVAGAVVVLALAAALYFFRGDLSLMLFRRGLADAMGNPQRALLDDGLHIGFCGTGAPLPDRSRAGPCTLVQAGDRLFVFDTGEGSTETLAMMGFSPTDIEAVYLTHLHSDHFDGLGPMALQHWGTGAAKAPLVLRGPAGVERIANGLNEAYAIDRTYRIAHHGEEVMPPDGFGLRAEAISIPQGEMSAVVLDDRGVRITAFLVEHAPVNPAFGYRVDYGGRSVVISGDTKKAASIAQMARGADLLVHEALSPRLVGMMEEAAREAGRPGPAKIFADIPSYHASPEDAAETAREAGVSMLALTHIIPPMPIAGLDAPFLGRARDIFGGDVWIMRDGDLISMPRTGGVQRSNILR